MARKAKRLRQVRRHLSDEQIVALLRAFGKGVGEQDLPHSSSSVNVELDEGRTLDEVFEEVDLGVPEPDMTGGFYLDCRRKGDLQFEIEFGWCFGTCGDGGTWLVQFKESGEIESIEQESFHIH